MYQTLPNLVLGFHGCNRETYEKVLYKHEELNIFIFKYSLFFPHQYILLKSQ